jgi:hypothetical protein
MGVKDAHNAINKGAAVSVDELIHYHALKKQGDKRMFKHSLGTFHESKANGEFEEYDIMKDDYMRKYTYKSIKSTPKK